MTTREWTRADVVESVVDAIGAVKEDEIGDLSEVTALYDYDQTVTHSLGLDSLDALDLVSLLEEKFDVQLPDGYPVEEVRTVRDLVDAICAALEASGTP